MPAVTIRDVARHADVSVASASRALNGHPSVTPATRERVIEAARLLDYVPHLGARSLSMRRTGMIGVVLPDLFGEFFSEIIRGIDRGVRRRGLHLLLSNMHGGADETASALRAMRGRVDGLLVMSPEVGPSFIESHLPADLPAVILNGPPGATGRTSLGIDNAAGVRAAVRHLVDQGCRQLAHIAGPAGNTDADERAAAFRASVAEELGIADPLVVPGDFGVATGAEAGRWLAAMRERVDGVFAANDIMAIGCMTALVEAGVRVPLDMAIVGFDDVPVAQYVSPALTTLGVDIAGMGTRAVDLLIETIERPDATDRGHQRLVPVLAARASSLRRPAAPTNNDNPELRDMGRLT